MPIENRNEPAQVGLQDSALWVTRVHAGKVKTRSDQGELLAWLAQSPQNGQAYMRSEVIWRLAGGLAADPKIKKEVQCLRQLLACQARLQVVP